jgi:hypothetical protein
MMRFVPLVLLVSVLLPGGLVLNSRGATQSEPDADPAGVVHALIHSLNTADAGALLELFAADATLYGPFAYSPARLMGKEKIRGLFEPLFSRLRDSAEGPDYMRLKPHDVHVQRLGDVAVASFHLGPLPDHPLERPYSFSRRTLVLQRSDDRWHIIHFHASNILIPASEGKTKE